MTQRPIIFADTETTHLSADVGEVWEVALIVRRDGADSEHVWQFRPDIVRASPEALSIGRYDERFAVPEGHDAAYINPLGVPYPRLRDDAITEISAILQDAVIVGSNPGFDDRHLRQLLNLHGKEQPWHYRPIDIAAMAAGYLYGQAERMTKQTCDAAWYGKVARRLGWPWKSYDASEAVGTPRPAGDAAHTALGDARWVRDLWDRMTVPDAFFAATDEQLADMVADALKRRAGER